LQHFARSILYSLEPLQSIIIMAEEERSSYRPIVLLGSENYSEWSLSISTVLMARGLLNYITSSQILDAEDQHKINRCFAFLIQSLSTIIVASLPALLRNPLSPDPAGLWKHLKRAYSAAVGAGFSHYTNKQMLLDKE
jgi:hypothetical protein